MKLNNRKAIKSYQKAILSQELRYYANLCKIYNNLANYANSHSRSHSSINIERRYGAALTNATKGDLDFLNDSDCIFSQKEKQLLKEYSKNARDFLTFDKASKMLNSATSNNHINKTELKNVSDYMKNTSDSTREFENHINNLGEFARNFHFNIIGRQSIANIRKIDPNHLPNSLSYISDQTVIEQSWNLIHSPKKYNSPKKFISHHKKQIAVLLAAGISLGTAFGVHNNYKENYNTQTTNYNAENNLKQYYSDDLISDVLSLSEDVKKLKPYVTDNLTQKQFSELSDLQDEISQIREKEDIIISDYMSEVGQKYCEQKGYQFVEATNAYDELRNKKAYKSSEGETYIYEVENPDLRKAENYLELTYIDSDGNTKQTELSEFSSSILETFEWEKKLDRTPTIKDLIDISDGINNLVGKDVKYSKVLGIHPVVSKEIEKEQETLASNKQTSTLNNENQTRLDDDYER